MAEETLRSSAWRCLRSSHHLRILALLHDFLNVFSRLGDVAFCKDTTISAPNCMLSLPSFGFLSFAIPSSRYLVKIMIHRIIAFSDAFKGTNTAQSTHNKKHLVTVTINNEPYTKVALREACRMWQFVYGFAVIDTPILKFSLSLIPEDAKN
ncbi:hypothetical protein L7F22_048161 [Adiantum nelumboides]|nr:hypothetical protein [Adiantum nelumboides]